MANLSEEQNISCNSQRIMVADTEAGLTFLPGVAEGGQPHPHRLDQLVRVEQTQLPQHVRVPTPLIIPRKRLRAEASPGGITRKAKPLLAGTGNVGSCAGWRRGIALQRAHWFIRR